MTVKSRGVGVRQNRLSKWSVDRVLAYQFICGIGILGLSLPGFAQALEPGVQASTGGSKASANRLVIDLNLPLRGLELPTLGAANLYLPGAPDIRLVVKLNKRRVYLYLGNKEIASYRIAVGKVGWETPIGTYSVLEKELNPIFKSFKSGRVVPPGPDNPLGVRWIGIWTDGKTRLGFHGTNEPDLIGQAVSHGCIRMLNKDVTALYEKVSVGTPVTVEP